MKTSAGPALRFAACARAPMRYGWYDVSHVIPLVAVCKRDAAARLATRAGGVQAADAGPRQVMGPAALPGRRHRDGRLPGVANTRATQARVGGMINGYADQLPGTALIPRRCGLNRPRGALA